MILHSLSESIIEDAILRAALLQKLLSKKLRVENKKASIAEGTCPTA